MSLEGGELAARLTPMQRVDMIQKGYNPMNPEDTQRYFNRQKPAGDMIQVASMPTEEGQNLNTFGESKMSYKKDYALLHREFGKDGFNDDLEMNASNRDFDFGGGQPTKASVSQRMQNYGPGTEATTIDINDSVERIVGKRQTQAGPSQQQRQVQQQPQRQVLQNDTQRQVGPIATPKATNVIMEAKQAAELGYKKGITYLNCFVRLLKQPSFDNRIQLINAMNDMVLTEERIHNKLLTEYRKGVSMAEQKMYDQIKAAKQV